MFLRLAVTASLALFLGACASDGDTTARRPADTDAYVTGSRIPKKEAATPGVSTMSREDFERAQADQMRLPPKGGGATPY
jgi:hypothetical protein